MDEPLPDERPQRRREYTGPWSTLGLAALVVLLVGFTVWFFEVRGGSGGGDGVGGATGVIPLDADLNPTGEPPAASEGRAAPNFALPNLGGEEATLADFRGDYVLVNFWASWCGPCRGETPDLQAFFEEHGAGGVVVLGVNQQESEAAARAFAGEFGVTYPILLDLDGEVSGAYRVNTGLPATFIVDPEGRIIEIVRGRITAEQLAEIAGLFAS